EGHCDVAGPSLYGHAHGELAVDVVGVIPAPRATGFQREYVHLIAIDRDVQSLFLGRARRACQLDFDLVVPILWKQMTDDRAAAPPGVRQGGPSGGAGGSARGVTRWGEPPREGGGPPVASRAIDLAADR